MAIAVKALSERPAGQTAQPLNDPIRQQFLATNDAGMAVARRSAAVDALVLDAFRQHLDGPCGNSLALLAVGGYGRRSLFPYSDVDLVLLFDEEEQAGAAKSSVASFVQLLWDSRIRLSQSVRTRRECLEWNDRNPELQISLLDQRFLAGSATTYARVAERYPRFVQSNKDNFFRALVRLNRARHARFNNTYFHLEPNIKDGPGGLRDLQLKSWLRQLRESNAQRVAKPEIDPRFVPDHAFLAALRCHLHYRAERDQNILSFDAQEEIAAMQGYTVVAAWMRQYFRHARSAWRATQRRLQEAETSSRTLFDSFRESRSRLSNSEVTVSNGQAFLKNPAAAEAKPETVLRVFEFVARHGVELSADAEQRIEQIAPRLREDPAAIHWDSLAAILSLRHAAAALRAMHRTGILFAVLPELEQIDSLVIRDFNHRYTVDEHTILAVSYVAGLRESAAAGEDPSLAAFRDLALECGEIAALLFAMLFHDAGKGGDSPAGHASASRGLAAAAAARLRMPTADCDFALCLIEQHLEMSAMLTARDPEDPGTARMLASRVETVERLRALTLLSWADISAVHPNAMTPWRAGQLLRLFRLTYQQLTRSLDTERVSEDPQHPHEWDAFVDGFPVRYISTHSEAEIRQDAALQAIAREKGIGISLERRHGLYRLALVTRDRPFLFASVTGTLATFKTNILKAEAFRNRSRYVLDCFLFADPARNLELNPDEEERLKLTLERVILGKQQVPKAPPQALKSKTASRQIPVAVSFDNEASDTASLVEILAPDRPGLLYDLARAIAAARCNIEVVLIDTEAGKAIDVFYLTFEGGKLNAERQAQLKTRLLEICSGSSGD